MSSSPIRHIVAQFDSGPFPISSARVDDALPPLPGPKTAEKGG
jgi:hypothetical protein